MESKILALPRFPFFSYEELAPWLIENLNPQQVENFLGHIGIYPQMLPTRPWQLMVIQAAWRVKMRKEKSPEPKEDKFFLPKELLHSSRSLAEAVSIFLDGQEPVGISEIYVREAAQNILLATCIAFEGKFGLGKSERVAEIELDFGLKEKQKINVSQDELALVPQTERSKVRIKIKTSDKAKIAGKRKISFEAEGGRVGIVIDCRGRPLAPPTADDEGRKRLVAWQESFLREF